MHKGNYKRIVDQGYNVCCKLNWKWRMDCCKKSMLFGFYHCRQPVWLALFVVFFSFMVHKVRDTFAWKLNWGQNKKLWGRGRGKKAMRTTTWNLPLEIYEIPLPVLRKEELAYMWCDMLWSLTSAITQCKTNCHAK